MTKTSPISRRGTTRTTESAVDFLVFGLGGNAGDSEAKLCWAIDRLEQLYGPMRIAPLYRTTPISPIEQPDFLNTVALAPLPAGDSLDPWSVLEGAKALEKLAGRRDGERHGPRPLDVDLLLFGNRVVERRRRRRRELTLPHPRMRQRRFVLAPLCDLTPDLELPPDGAIVRDLLAALGTAQGVAKIDWSRR